jgi:hypothetical protein
MIIQNRAGANRLAQWYFQFHATERRNTASDCVNEIQRPIRLFRERGA